MALLFANKAFKNLLRSLAIVIPVLLMVVYFSRSSPQARAALPVSADTLTDSTAANCRYGTTPVGNRVGEQARLLPALGAGWFLDFTALWRYGEIANQPEYVHIIGTHQKKTAAGRYLQDYYLDTPLDSTLGAYIQNNPGELWIVGNEVERGPDPGQISGGQGDMFADMYAVAYHDVREFIKQHDPTARVAISALVEMTPGRLQYLDMVWAAYRQRYGRDMPVDVWNMHIYVLPESQPDGVTPNGIASIALGTDPLLSRRGSGGNGLYCDEESVYCLAEHDDLSTFAEQVVAMRQWMKDHGQQNKPLILSEYGTLLQYITFDDGRCKYIRDEYGNCFDPQRVSTFMTKTFDYLKSARDPALGYPLDDDRLVQQWLWFALYNNAWEGFSANLVEKDMRTLTPMGQTFRDYVAGEPQTRNLVVERVRSTSTISGADGTATVTLSVSFRNNGDVAVDTPFRITFYEDAALQRPIDSITFKPLVRGCATRAYTAAVKWHNLENGVHDYWVKIDSDNVIAEQPGDGDNVGFGRIEVVQGYELRVTVKSDGDGIGGEVVVSPDKPLFGQNEQVTVTATAKPGWQFVGWEGAVRGTDPVKTISMDRHKQITAYFRQERYKLEMTPIGNGRIEVSPAKPFYVLGDVITLRAVPENGLLFGGWGGTLELYNTQNPLTVTVESDISATATFVDHLPPLFLPLDPPSVRVGYTMKFSVGAYDPEGVIPSLSAAGLPTDAQFIDYGNGSGRFTWTTTLRDGGSHDILLRASDGQLSTTMKVVLQVTQDKWEVLVPLVLK